MDKLQKYADSLGVQLSITRIPFRNDAEWQENAKHWAFVLSRTGKKSMKGYYSQGQAITKVPQLSDILCAVLIDTQGIEGISFDMWCGDLGYDTDSRKAFDIYQACLKEFTQLQALFDSKELKKLYTLSADC